MSRVLPILFNTEMVQAILYERKTATRRCVKPKQIATLGCDACPNNLPEEYINEKKFLFKPYCDMTDKELIKTLYKEPYELGDILYVRETWQDDRIYTHDDTPGRYFYRADDDADCHKWRPAIHMPKEAARIWLKVTDVRVERVQDIDDEGAKAEGANYGIGIAEKMRESAIDRFAKIWDSTIKKKELSLYGWYANPWVWVIKFERCEKPEEETY